MNIKILSIIAAAAISVTSMAVYSGETKAPESDPSTLKGVMGGLLKDNLKLNESIILQDFENIELYASKIANHPTPGIGTKMKLVGSLGSEMSNFKSLDTVVHDASVKIEKAAAAKDMKTVISAYQTMFAGCQACHSQYKERVAKILQ